MTQSKRIEEVKKILCRKIMVVHQGVPIDVYLPDNLIIELGDKISHLFPQPLPDEALRKKIVDSLTRYVLISNRIADKYNADPATHQSELGILMTEYTDNVLTLLQQRVEEAEKRGIDSGIVAYESTCEGLIQEAKKQIKSLVNFIEWLRDEELVSQDDWDIHCKNRWKYLKAKYLKQALGDNEEGEPPT